MHRSHLLIALTIAAMAGSAGPARAQTNPVITAPASASGLVGVITNVTGSASDPDGENVTLSQTNDTPFYPASSSAGPALNPSITLTATPVVGQAGNYLIHWTAVDLSVPAGSAAPVTTALRVGPDNQPPVITTPSTASGSENSAITVTASATDPDAGPLTLSQTNNAPFFPPPSTTGAIVNPVLSITGVPSFFQAGNYMINWSAVEAQAPGLSTTAITTVSIANVNRNPVIMAPATASGVENSSFSVTGSASDPDGQNVTLSQSNNAPFLTASSSSGPALNPSITLTGTPNFVQAGSYTVNWTAVDANVPAGSATPAATAISIASTRGPVITAPATVQSQENVSVSVTGSASDPDGQNVTLSQTNNAPFFPFPSSSSGPAPNPSITLTGVPSFSQAGSYTINWSAIDSNVPAGSATATTAISIGGPNRNPVIAAPVTASGTEGVSFSVTGSASDPDGQNVTLSQTNNAPFFPFSNSSSGPAPNPSITLTGVPNFSQTGGYTINWSAVDSNSPSGSSAATTAVTIGQPGRPVLDQPFDMTVDEGGIATQQLTATDPDGEPLTFFKVGASPLFMSVSAAGLVTLFPAFFDGGSYTAAVGVTDGVFTDTKSFAITVMFVNRCPTANANGPYQGVLFAAVAFDGAGSSDPDGDALSYVWDFGDGTTATGATPSHIYTVRGTFEVSLTVYDGACQDSDVTTAEIADGFTALAFTTGGNNSTSLGSGKPFICVEVEPVAESFNIANVELATVKMVSTGTGSVSEIFADAGKTSVGGDKNGNGATEIHACFAKADLRLLFSGLPAGSNQVTVTIQGSLLTGGAFQASLMMTIKATGGTLAATISPNPMNPSAKATFSTSKPGALKAQLFDLNGRLVRTLLQERAAPAGYHDVTIDGLTEVGKRLTSGVYYLKIWTEHEGSLTRTLTVLK